MLKDLADAAPIIDFGGAGHKKLDAVDLQFWMLATRRLDAVQVTDSGSRALVAGLYCAVLEALVLGSVELASVLGAGVGEKEEKPDTLRRRLQQARL